MTMMTGAHDGLDVDELIARLQSLAGDPTKEIEIGQALAEARPSLNGRWTGLLRALRPDLKRPDVWARRCITAARHALADAAPPQQARSPSTGGPGTEAGMSGGARPLDRRAARLYPRLRPLLALQGAERRAAVERVAEQIGASRSTVYRLLGKIGEGGAAALNRRRRRDRGPRLPQEAQQAFLRRRLDPSTRHETLQMSIYAVRREFPDLAIGDSPFRRIERTIPKALQMREQEWRATFLPSGQWEVPHPNHTHAFDMTLGDIFVWDGDPNDKPYRPHLTGIVDEHTHCCLFAMYTKGAPSRAVLQSVLLHAWLPKPDPRWAQHGAPLHLHCDNGKVQDSDWLKAVCRTLGSDLALVGDIRHAAVRSPWQQGHIERFFRIVHERYESQLGAGYCGNDRDAKPECFRDPTGGPEAWAQYPTLETLNVGLWTWIPVDYHQLYHRRLKMPRLEAWQAHARGHIHIPDRSYLLEALLQRGGARRVTRARVQINGMFYSHTLLQGYEGASLEVRWDPADLGKVLVLGYDGQTVCWAERMKSRRVDSPADLAELKEQRRATKQMRRTLEEATGMVAGADERTYQEHLEGLDAARREQVIPFPLPAKTRKPQPEPEVTPDEILTITGAGGEPETVEADEFTLHGLPI